MKRLFAFILLFTIIGCEHNIPDGPDDGYLMHDDFYYAGEEKFYLEQIVDEFFIIVKKNNQEQVVNQLHKKGFNLTCQPYAWNIPYEPSYGSLDEIIDCVVFTVKGSQDIASIKDIVYSNNLYMTPAGDKVGSAVESNTFMVKLAREDKDRQIETLKKYAVQKGYLILCAAARDYFKMACTNRT
ncbi:MAG: hypothetical protein ACI4UJ_07610, partial [Candidatus Cryptobacteroides sp.]